MSESSDRPDPASESPTESPPKKRRRRRRRRKPGQGEPGAESATTETDDGPPTEDDPDGEAVLMTPPPEIAHDPELFNLEKTFADLGLPEPIVRDVQRAGFVHPTHIQAQLIPPVLAGKDVLGQAKTGTGKSAAFGLPVLAMVEPGQPFQALILAPTRELAIQLRDGLRALAHQSRLKIVAVYGGQRIAVQSDALKRNPEVIVATPGRVMDMVDRGHVRLDRVRFAILDEVDRMLDIGFREDIRRILKMCPKDRQTVMVSATISAEIEDLARKYMRNAEKIVTSSGSLTVKMVKQHYLAVAAWDKKRLLAHLLSHESPDLTLVFCRLKRSVDELSEYLTRKGIEAHPMHGDMRQNQRDRTMERLRKGRLAVLIASDLASRGLDVEGITHVINYDLPEDPDVYVHRIGRTARAGRNGHAWSFVTPAQGKLLTQIEHLINAEIPKMEYPDFQPTEKPASFRDESPHAPPDLGPVPRARNRYAEPGVPAAAPRSDADKKRLETMFPGGVVPTKLPPKRLQGRLPTSRTTKLEDPPA
ncbi:MAG: DEAD/DEAH box helicase [Phycisphaeraceae bacterium]|nr:DEAD/DEAH box helicase [Phycisphaeraceae bacterium]